MPRQSLSYSDLTGRVTNRGYILLTKEEDFTGRYGDIEIKCPNPNHSSYKVKAVTFLRGNNCSRCSQPMKLTLKEVSQDFFQRGFLVLTEHYENREQMLDIQCGLGHQFKMPYKNLKAAKQPCPYCRKN